LAFGLSRDCGALSAARRAGPRAGRTAETAARRLLRAEAETLRILLHHARHTAAIPAGEDGDPDGHRGEYLRAVHRQRCIHARLRAESSGGLRRFEYRRGESLCPGTDAAGIEG